MGCPRCQFQVLAFFLLARTLPTQVAVAGWLGEFFVLEGDKRSCSNGIDSLVQGTIPNTTRKDITFEFKNHDSFFLRRCGWGIEHATGKRKYTCRSSDQVWERFAARWSGYINIVTEGEYEFELDVDGGARFTTGHADCPSHSCAGWDETMNARAGDLRKNAGDDSFTFANPCSICEQSSSTTVGVLCWATDNGCEPFGLWQLDADTEPCSSTQRKKVRGSRYLRAGQHPIKLEYVVRGGAARLFVRYKGPDTKGRKITVPSKAMTYPQIGGLFEDWYTLPEDASRLPMLGLGDGKSQFVERRISPIINNIVDGSPLSQELWTLGSTTGTVYAIRWTGFIRIGKVGDYTFKMSSDDGSRLYIGGAGRDEKLVIDQDGLLDFLNFKEGRINLNPGKHTVRVEYFFRYGHSDILPSPSGMIVEYSGPDTDLMFSPMTNLQATNPDCNLQYFGWRGLSLNADCDGKCIDEKEFILGDNFCDKPGKDYNLMCEVWDYDLGDCDPPRFAVMTTPRPEVTCYVDPPALEFQSRHLGKCRKEQDGYCVEEAREVCDEEDPVLCKYQRCCTAQIRNVPFWGDTCLAFGANSTCEETLAIKVAEIEQSFTLATDGPLEVKLLVDCGEDLCNAYPDTFDRNPLTNAPTTRRTCPDPKVPDEREEKGVNCYEGPWGLAEIRKPQYECQDTQWNFCRNSKEWDGKPFQRCCAYIYVIKSIAKAVCRFKGVAHGTCGQYLDRLTLELNKWPSQEIEMGETVEDCIGHGCNGPEEIGCPSAIIYDAVIPEDPKNKTPAEQGITSEGVVEKGMSQTELALIIVGCIVGLACGIGVWSSMQSGPTRNLWHSDKAKMVGKDCWIEPEKDAEVGMDYGCVKPKPSELRLLEKQQQPRADTRPAGLKRIMAMEAAMEEDADGSKAESRSRKASKSTVAEDTAIPETEMQKIEPAWPAALADQHDSEEPGMLHHPALALPGAVPAVAATPPSTAASTLEQNMMMPQPAQQPKPMRQPPAAARSKRKGFVPVPARDFMTMEQLDTGYRATIPKANEPLNRPTSILSLQDEVFEKPSVPALADFEQPSAPALADAPPETAIVASH